MLKTEEYRSFLPPGLLAQIEEISALLSQLQGEAAGLAHHTDVGDASAQLQNVLESTEEATTHILDAATAIQSIADVFTSPDEAQRVRDHVTKIYEACNFQDVSGQRIKKVLKVLGTLEVRIAKLAESARTSGRAEAIDTGHSTDKLAQGPQLKKDTPNQQDIDKLFASTKKS